MKINKKKISKYYDKRSATQVLGCLMRDPKLVVSKEFPVGDYDFVSPFHITLFVVVHNLALQGITKIGLADVETYLANNDAVAHSRMFDNGDGAEWVTSLIEDANELNYEYYHKTLRKFSYLRAKMEQGQDVSMLLDMEEIDLNLLETQREKFDALSVNDIIRYFDKLHIEAKEQFTTRSVESSRKVGDNAHVLRERLKNSPDFGYNLESEYLNTITRGGRRGTFLLETRDTGRGKSRVAIERLLGIIVPERWCHKTKKFIINPFYQPDESGLYIGTELELATEVELMNWAFVSGVSEHKIRMNELTDEENERIDYAIEILQRTRLYMEDEPNYDLAFLWATIERYKTNYNVTSVAIDYLEGTAGILSEYAQMSKGLAKREDQALLNLSKEIKDMARHFDVFMMGFTQTNNEARRDHTIRDSGAIKGSTALANKCDVGITVFAPTKKELEYVQPLIEKASIGLHTSTCVPNMIYTIYKNRGGIHSDIKIWVYVDLGTMEVKDLFCTNLIYMPINIDKTQIISKPKQDIKCDENGEIIEDDATGIFGDLDIPDIDDMPVKPKRGF